MRDLRSNAVVILGLLAACGGKHGGIGSSAQYAAKCESPRSGTNPLTHQAYPDTQGSALDEKKWLRAWTDELYLWYREVPSLDPASPQYPKPVDYFRDLKTTALTPSGNPKDRFHFTYATDAWEALSQSGVQAGYGAQWVIIQPAPPRLVRVAYTEPGSPAAMAGIQRGDTVLTIDGETVQDSGNVAVLNRGLSPPALNETHTFTIQGRSSTRTVSLTSATIQISSVQNPYSLPTPTGKVGYMLFNTHIATSEAALISAVNQFRSDGVVDLVIDLRYNGGGYLDIANELAYMIAGSTATNGKIFEKTVFNDKYPNSDPVTGAPVADPFQSHTLGFSTSRGLPLPTLGLGRLFLLTASGTCSASESIINGLRGIDVQIVQIGTTTCGKPYGFYPQDNCGTTYFSIELQTVNNKGFGDYADGFTPGGTGPAGLPGCNNVADDFSHDLGDPNEARFAAALAYRANQTCSISGPLQVEGSGTSTTEPQLIRSPWHENRIYTR